MQVETTLASRTAAQHQDRNARLRRASLLNILLPGSGQFYLGQRGLGLGLLTGFLLPFIAALAVFLVSTSHYYAIATSVDLLDGQNLESLGTVFHLPWLIGLTALAVADFLVSMALLWLRPPG